MLLTSLHTKGLTLVSSESKLLWFHTMTRHWNNNTLLVVVATSSRHLGSIIDAWSWWDEELILIRLIELDLARILTTLIYIYYAVFPISICSHNYPLTQKEAPAWATNKYIIVVWFFPSWIDCHICLDENDKRDGSSSKAVCNLSIDRHLITLYVLCCLLST